jgi:hypothetical protein
MKLWIPAFACGALVSILFACRATPSASEALAAEKSAAAAERMAAAAEKLAAAAEKTAAAAERVAALEARPEPTSSIPPPARVVLAPTHAASHEDVEHALQNGLAWLARHQNLDGSWSPATLEVLCSADSPSFEAQAKWTRSYDEGLTGLALLAFLQRGGASVSGGELVDADTGARHSIDDVVARGLAWLKQRQHDDGSFSRDRAFMYNEAVATRAMIAAYSATHSAEWKACAQRGVEFIEKAQRPSFDGKGLWGWRYASRMDVEAKRPNEASELQFQKELFESDTSITGWCADTLRAARDAGLEVRDESLAGAYAYTQWTTGQNGLVGYTEPRTAGMTVSGKNDHFVYHVAAMSALGVCTRLDTHPDPKDPFFALAARRIAGDTPGSSKDPLAIDYYYWHFGTQALRGLAALDASDTAMASTSGHWNTYVVQALLPLQDHSPKSCRQGGWITGDRWCYTGGPIYATAINVLTLEAASGR